MTIKSNNDSHQVEILSLNKEKLDLEVRYKDSENELTNLKDEFEKMTREASSAMKEDEFKILQYEYEENIVAVQLFLNKLAYYFKKKNLKSISYL